MNSQEEQFAAFILLEKARLLFIAARSETR
jgi:hypothetical protein